MFWLFGFEYSCCPSLHAVSLNYVFILNAGLQVLTTIHGKSSAVWCCQYIVKQTAASPQQTASAESLFPLDSRPGIYHSEMRCVRVEVVEEHGESHTGVRWGAARPPK